MKRKIIKLGQATFVASLPSKWMRKHGLAKGDYLEFEEKANQLIISTKRNLPDMEVTLDLKQLNSRLISTYVQCYFLLGYDKIILLHNHNIIEYKTGDEISTTKYIQSLVNRRLIGVEIVDQSESKTVLVDLSGIKEEAKSQVFNRIVFMIKTLAQDCYDGISNNKLEELSIIEHRYHNINRFLMHYQRVFVKSGECDSQSYAYTLQLFSQLKYIAGTYYHIAKMVTNQDVMFSSKALKLFAKLNKALDMSLSQCLGFNKDKALDFIELRDKIWKDITDAQKNFKRDDLLLLTFLMSLMFPTYLVLKTCFTLDQIDKKAD
jgi:phosphate uptake regulator